MDDTWIDIGLEPLEYNLLIVLVDAQGAIVDKWTCIERVFTENEDEYDDEKLKRRLYTYVHNINRKLAAQAIDFNHIVNRREVGYMFLSEKK